LTNPNEAQAELFPGIMRAKVSAAGERDVLFKTPFVPVRSGKSYIFYAIGNPFDDSFNILAQVIDLDTRGRGRWR
jgi:hypothetical protein